VGFFLLRPSVLVAGMAFATCKLDPVDIRIVAVWTNGGLLDSGFGRFSFLGHLVLLS
jgi:hypothetical protein